MLLHRILVAGYDRGANQDFSKYLARNNPALVLAENEFQKTLETGDKNWLSLLIDMEDFYRQDLMVLWFGENSKKLVREKNPNNELIIKYCNEILWEPYSNKIKHLHRKTHVYFIDISQKVKYDDLSRVIKDEIGRNAVIPFSTKNNFVWSFPSQIIEMV